jgi:hypothetical protein
MESFTKKNKKIKRMDDNTELGETNSSKNDQAP